MKQYFLSLLTGFLVLFTSRPFDGTVWNNPLQAASPSVTHQAFHSASLGAEVGFNIYLPSDYERDSQRRFPVVYFLHGKSGDENTETMRFLNFLRSGGAPKAIVVFPNGGRNSKFIDAVPGSPMDGRVMTETMLIKELIPFIDGHYRTVPVRNARALQGFSMGGMGALRLGFKHPDLFCSVYAFAPALNDTPETLPKTEGALLKYMLNGDAGVWESEMVATQLKDHAPQIRDVGTRIGLSVGAEDGLLPWARDLSIHLDTLQIPHTFDVIPGLGHAYAFGSNFVAFEPCLEHAP